MSYKIKEIIPGSGREWYCDPLTDRVNWLLDNVGKGNFIVEFKGLKSDEMSIEFNSDVDAMAYRLRWIRNEHN